MQKFFLKVHFLRKFCKENHQGVTQPLKFLVQKSCLDMHIIVHKFENNWFIHFKNCICDYLCPKIAYLSPYETHISKIIFICIKNCHNRVNHHCWNVQIWFYISALAPLCYEFYLNIYQSDISGWGQEWNFNKCWDTNMKKLWFLK